MTQMLCVLTCFILLATQLNARPYDYPTARTSTVWTNNNDAMDHTVTYPDGSQVRVMLLSASIPAGSFFGPTYAAGFVCLSPCSSFLFAVFIIYTNSGSTITMPNLGLPHIVWASNRDKPVRENATLQFTADGQLVLRDVDNTTVWYTNTTKKSVVLMQLKDDGNLVLLDNHNSTVWASFENPTDAVVPGQLLLPGRRLMANSSVSNASEGQVWLTIANQQLIAYVNSEPLQVYYNRSLDSTNSTYFTTSMNGSLEFLNASSAQYMRLEMDGHFRVYRWNDIRGWSPIANIFDVYPSGDNCAYPTVCGAYGICSNNECSCPQTNSSIYFRPISNIKPSLGCSMVTPLSCNLMQDHQLLRLDNVSYFNSDFDGNAVGFAMDEDSCKRACLRNCSCKAAIFRYSSNISDGVCLLPNQIFSFKGIEPDVMHYNASTYVKVQVTSTSSNATKTAPSSPSKSRSAAVITGSTIGVFGFVIFVTIVLFVRRKKQMEEEEDDPLDHVPGMPTRFSFEELKVATGDFCKKLGEGGFGSVFEGALPDGTKIAVKRLDGVGQGKQEFLAEVQIIGSIHHINLVRLIGFCTEKSNRLLVLEYMCNGSLDNWIFYKNNGSSLDWQTRRKIVADIAKGLSYLHEGCRQRIAHLDIKPQNILLDEKFNAKVSDFGLSKLIDRDESRVMTRMRGTPGYLAPEWLTSIITEKVDVYSFGVVVMEILCSRKNLDHSQPEESRHLIRHLEDVAKRDCLLDIIDKNNSDMQLHLEEVAEMIKIAMWCLQSDSNKRPAMSTVVKILEGTMAMEGSLDYNFTTPSASSQNISDNRSTTSPLLASVLSGPR